MTFPDLVRHFGAKKQRRKGEYLARCTGHPDRSPSLAITDGRGKALLTCRSHQCDIRSICAGAGIKVRDLYYEQRTDPKAIREAEKQREYGEAVRTKWLLQYRYMIADLERWSRVAAALYWHLQRNPHDIAVSGWYEEALDHCHGDPAPWPKHQPYSPFPTQKLLHGIKASQTTPEIARFLKLRG